MYTLRLLPSKFSLYCHYINYFFLKDLSRAVSPLLETLYNECLKHGLFLQCLKVNKIVSFSKAVIVTNPRTTDQPQYFQPLANCSKKYYITEFTRLRTKTTYFQKVNSFSKQS